ncbi:hypothetical protein J4453_03665 [Candidatus Woesearchaeota archaeon]|nr:hypothetical protein [Candidatus Woesearchaeota archaeon]
MYADIVYPDKNEKEFIQMAEKLGYGALVFAYPLPSIPSSLPSGRNVKLFRAADASFRELNKAKKEVDFVFCEKDLNSQLVFEGRMADLIYGFGLHEKQDPLHQRASELNQILCKLAAKNKVAVGFPFRAFLTASPLQQSFYLGRLAQNWELCRKYKVPMVIGSFARHPLEMRAPRDLISFFSLAGAHPHEAQQAFQAIFSARSNKTNVFK